MLASPALLSKARRVRRFALTTKPKRACGSTSHRRAPVRSFFRPSSLLRAQLGLSQARAYAVARDFHELETNEAQGDLRSIITSLRTMFRSFRNADLVIGPLEATGGQVGVPRNNISLKFVGLLSFALLSVIVIAAEIGLAPAKPSDNEDEAHDSTNSIPGNQQSTISSSRLAEPITEGAEATLGGSSFGSEVHIGGQDVPTPSKSYQDSLAQPPELAGHAIPPPDLSSEPSLVPSRPPEGPVLLRQVDRTALRNLTVSLLASKPSRPEKAEPLTTAATLARKPRRRQRGRITPVQRV